MQFIGSVPTGSQLLPFSGSLKSLLALSQPQIIHSSLTKHTVDLPKVPEDTRDLLESDSCSQRRAWEMCWTRGAAPLGSQGPGQAVTCEDLTTLVRNPVLLENQCLHCERFVYRLFSKPKLAPTIFSSSAPLKLFPDSTEPLRSTITSACPTAFSDKCFPEQR